MDTMDLDMDMDVDFVPDEPITTQAQDTPSPGEVVDETPQKENEDDVLVPTKIYIRGLDVLNPDEVKAYVAEQYPGGKLDRLEWIDDSSANLLFASESIAQEALVALASVEIGDVTLLPIKELLPAKTFSQRTEVALQVRLAVASDKKIVGAAQRSRFYLLNPEYDPENRQRHGYRDRGDNRRGYGGRHQRDDDAEPFDVNLYDDNAEVPASRSTDSRPRRRRSYTPDYDSHDRNRRSSHRNDNRSKELFPDHAHDGQTSRRDRSASPVRDRDGDLGMDPARSDGSSEKNRRRATAIKSRLARDDQPKELFPGAVKSVESNRLEDADGTDSYLSSRFSLPLYDGSNDRVPARPGKKLEDRVTTPGRGGGGGGGRLADRITDPTAAVSFSIRGAASQKGAEQGFTIKGGANKSARELFPDKFGSNNGKELFADRSDGRSRPRQKAGDLFD